MPVPGLPRPKLFAAISTTLGCFALVAVPPSTARAQAASLGEISISDGDGLVVVPPSSVQLAVDAGVRAHTNMRLFFPGFIRAAHSHPFGRFETPGSLACVYGLVVKQAGCNPGTATTVATGGSRIVAIVDAYDYPTAVNDLTVYSSRFGLPPITPDNFQVIYADGTQPKQDPNGNWELEEALDIELAHAMAPGAKIILVEARSSSLKDLYAATRVAGDLVAASGGGEVSSSWGGAETRNEEDNETMFQADNVVFLAATGDEPGTNQPSVLQNVVATGGTSIDRDANYDLIGQTTWRATGGGSSKFVPTPSYQTGIASIVGNKRGVPDISFDANPRTGVWVYDSTPYFKKTYNWLVVGGTSIASPALAGVLNSAGHFAASTQTELALIYSVYQQPDTWTDIRRGRCGLGHILQSVKGWDFCSGVGVPAGYAGK